MFSAYAIPSCKFGKLLKALTKQDTFMEKLVNTYLKSREGTGHKKEDHHVSLREAAARCLLAVMPGLDALSLFSTNVSG